MDERSASGLEGVWEKIVPAQEPDLLRRVLLCAVCLAAAILARLPFEPFLGGSLPYATFFPMVLAATFLAGGVSGAIVLIAGCPIALALFGDAAVAQAPIASVIIWFFNGGILLLAGLGVRRLVRLQRASRAALEDSQQTLTTMLHEFDHRTRNAFSLIQAISSQTAKSSRSINDYKDRLHDRIATLAAAKTLLLAQPGEAVSLSTVIDVALRPFLDERAGQIEIGRGPECLVGTGSCTSLTLALHELATNAAKYGALSTPEGRVACGWDTVDGLVRISWRERGGPPVAPPSHSGFGSTLIRGALAAEPGGRVTLEFPPGGVACDMQFAPAAPCASAPEPAMAV